MSISNAYPPTEDKEEEEGDAFCEQLDRACDKLPATKKIKLIGFSPQENYTNRATAACRRSYCQLLRIESHMVSATDPHGC
jgi:hypothetical protein